MKTAWNAFLAECKRRLRLFFPGKSSEIKALRIRRVNAGIIFAACVLLLLFLTEMRRTDHAYDALQNATEKYVVSELAANALKHASDYLTTQVRMFTVTEDPAYMEGYFQEARGSLRRENAVKELETRLQGTDAERYLESALAYSNELMEREYYAMKLVVDARGYPLTGLAAALDDVDLKAEDAALSPQEKVWLARLMTHDAEYQRYDNLIDRNVSDCIENLNQERDQAQQESAQVLARQLLLLEILAALLLAVVLACLFVTMDLVILPLKLHVRRITESLPLPMTGVYELQYLAQAYNAMYNANRERSQLLQHEAEHDALTGLYNRAAFDRFQTAGPPAALLLMDVDKFKEVNDTFGHDTGDQVLKKVASLLDHSFRFTDYPCRVGGDEFAVLLSSPATEAQVRERLDRIRERLRSDADGLPAVTLSVGVAFGGPDAYKNADKALYAVKKRGRDGVAFYDRLSAQEK